MRGQGHDIRDCDNGISRSGIGSAAELCIGIHDRICRRDGQCAIAARHSLSDTRRPLRGAIEERRTARARHEKEDERAKNKRPRKTALQCRLDAISAFHGDTSLLFAPDFSTILNCTRRFFCRPSAVSLSVRGSSMP